MRYHRYFWVCTVIFLHALLVYGPSLSYPLLYWDDFKHICENNLINPPTLIGFLKIWSTSYFGMYIPVTYSVWSGLLALVQYILPTGSECIHWGPAFHCLSLLLHIANSILAFRIIRRFSGSDVGSILGALLFCAHPLQVEAVVWVSGTRDLLSAFFGLCGILAYLNDKKKTANVLMILALFAKPSGIIFPFLVMVLNWRHWRAHFVALWPSICAGFLVVAITQVVQGNKIGLPEVPFTFRILLMLSNLGFYLWKVILPIHLVPMYNLSIRSALADFTLLLPSLVTLFLIIFLLIFRRNVVGPAIAWISIAFLPVSGLVIFGFQEISTVADRYFYVSMLGVSLIVSSYLTRKSRYVKVSLLLIVLSVLSFHQVGFWRNDEAIFQHTLEVNPRAVGAHSSLGFYYMRQRRFGDSELQFRQALSKNSHHFSSWLGLGRILQMQNKYAEAESTYRAAIENRSALPEVYNNLGAMIYERGALEESRAYFITAAERAPLYLEPRFNLGQVYLDTGRYVEAVKAFRSAGQVAPGNRLVLEKIEEAQEMLNRKKKSSQ